MSVESIYLVLWYLICKVEISSVKPVAYTQTQIHTHLQLNSSGMHVFACSLY